MGRPEPEWYHVRVTESDDIEDDWFHFWNCRVDAIFGVMMARNWDEFRAALSNFTTPDLSFVYADIQGNIGYQMAGRIPIRRDGHTGRFPITS